MLEKTTALYKDSLLSTRQSKLQMIVLWFLKIQLLGGLSACI